MHKDMEVYLKGCKGMPLFNVILYFITCHGWHIMLLFRLGKIIYAVNIPVISHILKLLFQILWFLITTFYGIWLDLSCDIGPGFYIGHFGGIVINGKFGSNCSIGQGVTVGSKGAGKSDGWPVLGDNVYIGAGAKIIGSINIGSHSVIGANAVVIKDVPQNSLAAGVPAIIRALS
jgi:serine O-acetyltransferase